MNIKTTITMVTVLLLTVLLNTGCVNNTQQKGPENVLNTDTIKRPPNVSKQATLINFGGDDIPVFVWVEHIGPLIDNGKEYPHIQGVRFYYVKARMEDIIYYENLEMRDASRKFNFAASKVLEYPGDVNVHLANGKDSIAMFRVLESDEFKRVHRGIEFKDMPTIAINQYGELAGDVDMEFNIKKEDGGKYLLTLNDGSKILYKLCSTCNGKPETISFLNRQDGRIYFINRDCYLELINKDDVKNFQGLR